MDIDKSIYWDIREICQNYSKHKNSGGTKTFIDWYFPNDDSRVIKKIYFKEKYAMFISLYELSYLANLFADTRKEKDVWFSDWFDEIKPLLERKFKIDKIRNGYKTENRDNNS